MSEGAVEKKVAVTASSRTGSDTSAGSVHHSSTSTPPSAYADTKIGKLPISWQVVRLADVTAPSAPIRYGVVQIGPHTADGVPIVPIKHIRKIDSATLHRASPEIEAAYAGSRVRSGDVLISVKGTIGEVGVVPVGFEGNIAREIARIRPKSNCDAHFLSYQLEADHTQRRIDSKVVGSTRLEFSIHAVRDFLIALPPLPEQRTIAVILHTWDEAIEKLHKQRAMKEQWLKWTARTLLARIHNSSDSEERPLGEIAHIVKGEQLNKLDIALGKYPVWNGGISPSGFHDASNTDGGTITISEGGNSCGFVNFEERSFWLGGHCYALKELSNDVDKNFLYHSLKAREAEIMRLRVGSGLPNIQRRDLQRLKVTVPIPLEQKRISSALTAANRELVLLDRKIQAITRQKRGLMQKLLTGEWRVQGE